MTFEACKYHMFNPFQWILFNDLFCQQEWFQVVLQAEPIPRAALDPGEELEVRRLQGPQDLDHQERHLVCQDGWPPG